MTKGVKYKDSEGNMKQEKTIHCCCKRQEQQHETLHHDVYSDDAHSHSHSHEHHHHHHHHHHANHAIAVVRIALTVVLLIVAKVIGHYMALPMWKLLMVYLVPYLIVGWGTLKEAAEGIAHGDVFNENFLMAVATIGALCIGFLPDAEPEFMEAVGVMLFFQVGELFEGYAEGNARKSISHLMNIRPDMVTVVRDGKPQQVEPNDVKVGETILIKPGEKVPLDGEVVKGQSSLNTLALTGESEPRFVAETDSVLSGCINMEGVLEVRATKAYSESTVAKIIQLVESANERKSKSETFITRFARVYTPIVVIAALALAFVPPLFAAEGFVVAFSQWLYRALIFLVVSCPCALVISVPLSFFGGIGAASRHGILVKGSIYIDALSRLKTVVFDKTGTLTYGRFEVQAVHPDHYDAHQLLHLAAHVEHYTSHPIGAALRAAFPQEDSDGCSVEAVEEVTGEGIRAEVNGHAVCVGNAKMMQRIGAQWHDCHHVGTIIHVAVDGVYVGHIVINDKVKDDSANAIAALKKQGVKQTVMLTGDRKAVGEMVAKQLTIDSCYAELLPAEKVERMEQLMRKQPNGATLAFVGDGINDAPVLKRADVGIAMGALGSDAAIEAADVVLMDDQPSKIALAMRIARRTIGIAKQNIVLAIGVKVAVLVLATMGLGNMWLAVMADVGVTVLAVLNAMRALRVRA